MTSQMKKVLLYTLILSFTTLIGLVILLVAKQFVFSYVVSYLVLVINIGVTAYYYYLYMLVNKQDKLFKQEVFYAKKLLKLRERALLDFYVKRGIIPQYNKNGKLLNPDELLEILTQLDENGKLTKSIYEMLGIEPKFDKYGKEIPYIVVLKHLMGKPRTKDFKVVEKFAKLKSKGSIVNKVKSADKKLTATKSVQKQESGVKVANPKKVGGISRIASGGSKKSGGSSPAKSTSEKSGEKKGNSTNVKVEQKENADTEYKVREYVSNARFGGLDVGDKQKNVTNEQNANNSPGECVFE